MRVYSWSKRGWKPEEKEVSIPLVKRPYTQTDFDFVPSGDARHLHNAQQEIQTGSIQDAIDELPNLARQLLQAPDEWYFAAGNRIMKAVDPITQALDGEWGSDASESDVEVLDEHRGPTLMLLEDLQMMSNTTEGHQDLMGEVLETRDKEVETNAKLTRIYVPLRQIGEEGEEYITVRKEPAPILPHLSEETCKEVEEIRAKYIEKLDKAESEKEREIAILAMEKEIDKVTGRELCNKLDSPYCAMGYSKPRQKYEFILSDQVSDLTEAAEARGEFFYTLFAEAASCTTMHDLYGPLITETGVSEWGEPTTKRGRPGGFAGKIRGMYQHDKGIIKEWSEEALKQQRTELITKMREENKDEETIRKTTWVWFDRVATRIPAVYKKGKLEKEGKSWKDSIWRQRRTRAMKDMFLTTPQWRSIYKMIELQKKRIKQNTNPDENEKKAIVILQTHFERVTTLHDLKAYKAWAEKREFIYENITKQYEDEKGRKRQRTVGKKNTWDFHPSLIEYLSANNANRWWKSVIRKMHYLQGRVALFHKLSNHMNVVHKTSLPSISIPCPHPQCDAMAIGNPMFAELKEDKGHLFVKCDCGKDVWLIGHKESAANIKTQEEAENAYLSSNQ
jgi:hypothetical protein